MSRLLFLLLLLACVSAAFGVTPPALVITDNAGSTVTIDATSFTCVGTCTTNLGPIRNPGAIIWAGTVGAFTVNVVDAQTKPALPAPQVNIGLLIETAATGGTITVTWTDVGFDGTGPATMNVANTLAGNVSATYTGYIDSTNAPFGTATTVGTVGPFTTTNSATITGPGPVNEPFSMTTVTTLVMGASSSVSLAGFNLMAAPPPPLSLACASASGQVGMAYDSYLMASGGFPPYNYSIIGNLPTGLSLNPSTGEISGTPQAAGPFSFTAQVMDSSGNQATNTVQSSCSITITMPPVPLAVTCPANTGEVGAAYSSSAVATGGTAPYTFSISSGALPTGLTINAATGAITGTPQVAGPASFTIQVMDSSGNSATNTVTTACGINITSGPSLTCSATNSGEVGVAFNSGPMTVSGGTAPYTFSVATGTLPNGLNLNTSTGAITGTPTSTGTFTGAR